MSKEDREKGEKSDRGLKITAGEGVALDSAEYGSAGGWG
jgi:hypothetical protein